MWRKQNGVLAYSLNFAGKRDEKRGCDKHEINVQIIIVFFITLALAGCSHTREISLVMVADGLKFELQAPSSFDQSMTLTQSVEIRFEDKTYDLIFVTEINPERIVIVGILPNGSRVFTVSYDGDTIHSDGYGGLVESIGPEYFLADFQMAQWPLRTLKKSFKLNSECFDSGQCLLSESADGLNRSLEKSGSPVVYISYSELPRYAGTIEFKNYQRGYTLQVTTVGMERP
jgi:hypothetical protein